MENVINISILADSVSPSGAISAGVQGDDKTTVLNVSVDEAVLPTVSDTQSLRVLAEAVNGAGEYYVTEFLEMVDNIITFPLPLEITRGGGQATLHFVFVVLDENGGQVSAKYSSEIKLRFEDSAQFYQSEYLDTMASALAELYKYRKILADYDDSVTVQEHFDELDEQIENLEREYRKLEMKLSGKVDKVSGYGLSKNDFNDDYKSTLDEYPNTIESILEKIEQVKKDNMARTPLPDGAIDLNTLITSAWWYTAEQRIDITNTPVGLAELELIVTRDVISITQILIASDGGVGIYLRFSHDSGRNWTNWQKVVTDADISVLNQNLTEKFIELDNELDNKVSSVNGKNGTVTVTGDDIPLEEGSQTIIGPFVTDLSNKFVKLNDDLEDKFTLIENTLDSKVSSVNGKNGTVTVTGADIPLEEGSQTLIAPYINSINSSVLQMNEKINRDLKNHTSFHARRVTANTVYINLGKFTGDNGGGKAIITISGNPYWGAKSDGGFRVLTLSSNSYSDISSTDIHTGASLYDFGQSNYTGTEIVDDQYNIQVALVRPNGYSVAEVDVYLKFNNYQYNSYLVTVDYSDGCSWVTSTEKVTTSDPDPMENALSAFIVPKRQIADLTKLETKADVETGNCTLTVSAGNISNASYSKTGKDVTVNFWFYPADTNEVVVSGLPYVATKNQSGIASASVGGVRVSYEMSKDNANATLYPETTSEQYCTLTYNLGAYNPQP